MKFHIISLFPNIIEEYFSNGILRQALDKKVFQYKVYNPRDFTTDKHKSVDDTPYGGGDGMVMMYQPLKKALYAIANYQKSPANFLVIYLSPQGELWQQKEASKLSKINKEIVFICGRYAGIDQRFIHRFVDREISIGDYIISGGELAACVLMDSCLRNLDGVLGNQDSAKFDTFYKSRLEGPCYTRPSEIDGLRVPDVLLSGDHKKILDWREKMSLKLTRERRPDLLQSGEKATKTSETKN